VEIKFVIVADEPTIEDTLTIALQDKRLIIVSLDARSIWRFIALMEEAPHAFVFDMKLPENARHAVASKFPDCKTILMKDVGDTSSAADQKRGFRAPILLPRPLSMTSLLKVLDSPEQAAKTPLVQPLEDHDSVCASTAVATSAVVVGA